MSFLGFNSTRLGLWTVLPKETPTKKNKTGRSSEAQTQDHWITSQTLYHRATQDPIISLNARALNRSKLKVCEEEEIWRQYE